MLTFGERIPTRYVRYPKEIFFENLQPDPQSEGCNNALRHFFSNKTWEHSRLIDAE